MPAGAIIGGIGALASAGASIYGANKAADAQTQAANQANSTIKDQLAQNQSMYDTNASNLAPWMTRAQGAGDLTSFLTGASGTAPAGYNGAMGGQGALTTPFAPTQAQLESTPGFQFIRDQGLKSTQNSYASKGLGSSGAAMKGAADYAEGLAGTTYQQQFQNYWNQNKSIYDMLTGQSQQGLQAAGALATNSTQFAGIGTQGATSMGSNIIGAGNAQAAGYNAMGTAVGNAANSIGQYGLLSNYMSNGTVNAPWSGGTVGVGNYQMPTVGYNAYGY
jgi:hypothetical protein